MKIGVHELEFEEPDLATMQIRGEATVADAQEMSDVIVAFAPGGRVFILSHLGGPADAGMSAQARKTFIDGMRHVTLVGVAVVGGSFKARIFARLVDAAMRVLSQSPTELRFFDDDPSARAWLRDRGCLARRSSSAPDRSSGSS